MEVWARQAEASTKARTTAHTLPMALGILAGATPLLSDRRTSTKSQFLWLCRHPLPPLAKSGLTAWRARGCQVRKFGSQGRKSGSHAGEWEREADDAITPKLIEEAFDEFIVAERAASSNPDAYQTTESKYNTIKRRLTNFLNIQNCGKPVPDRVLYVHQITFPLLINGWRPGNRRLTGRSRRSATTRSRSSNIASLRSGLSRRSTNRGNPARGMARIVGRKDSSIPTLPFTPAQFEAVLRACTSFDLSLQTVNQVEVTKRGHGKILERAGAFTEATAALSAEHLTSPGATLGTVATGELDLIRCGID